MKKLLCVIMAVVMVLCVSACASGGVSQEEFDALKTKYEAVSPSNSLSKVKSELEGIFPNVSIHESETDKAKILETTIILSMSEATTGKWENTASEFGEKAAGLLVNDWFDYDFIFIDIFVDGLGMMTSLSLNCSNSETQSMDWKTSSSISSGSMKDKAITPPVASSSSSVGEQTEPIIRVENLPLEISIRQPDSLGNVYLDATFTNNSEYPITRFEAVILLKDQNKKTYLTAHDTVLPGEVSPQFDSFGPKTQTMEDVEILGYSFTISTEGDQEIYLRYDCKLDKYNQI